MGADPTPEDWLRFTLVDGIGGAYQRRLLSRFGSPAAALAASPGDLSPLLPAAAAAAWRRGADAQAVTRALAWSAESGNRIISLADTEYPAALLQTPDPPTVVYAKGRLELLQRPALAIVGSRNATPQGIRDAAAFARTFSDAGLTVVSGLALGIDAAAHEGGLAGSGSTVAVVGTGLDIVYPARNRALAHRVAEQGLLLSEFALGTPAAAANFPRRNRIISGLARGVLVVEAALRSGSLITARTAADQGREVFAIPGSIHSTLARGCHALIKQGAKLVESAQDVLEELGMLPVPAVGGDTDTARHDEDPVLAALGTDSCDADTLAERTGLTITELQGRLGELVVEGAIAPLPGGKYQRIHNPGR